VLALAAANGKHFRSDVYVVAATVLPVYIIALMLPGSIVTHIGEMSERASRALDYAPEDVRNWVDAIWGVNMSRTLTRVRGGVALIGFAAAVCFLAGEIAAILCLSSGSATSLDRTVVVVTTIAMTVAVTVVALLSVIFGWKVRQMAGVVEVWEREYAVGGQVKGDSAS
jgi:hypothetical protein